MPRLFWHLEQQLKISLSQTILHHVWSSIVHPGKYKLSFTSLQHSFRTNSWGNPAIWVKFWTYPWARPWCPVWPWPPAGPDYFPPGLLCPSPSAPYSILLSSSQNNQTHICGNLKIDFFHFHQDFQHPPETSWLVASPSSSYSTDSTAKQSICVLALGAHKFDCFRNVN